MKLKHKKAIEGGIWLIIVGAIVAIAVGFIILFITRGGLTAGKDNINLLSSCGNQGGHCEKSCSEDERSFYKLGCPDENGDGNVDKSEEGKDNCCIPKRT